MPAFYLDCLIGFLRQGFAEVINPFSGRTSRVDVAPEHVHTLVLWSKDFGPFLRNPDAFRDYRLYFLFTLNDMPELEPRVPPLRKRLDQVRELTARYGPGRIGWRFDPVVFRKEGPVMTDDSFRGIGEKMAESGVRRAIFSFLDLYGKVKTRNERFALGIVNPPLAVKREYAAKLAVHAREIGLSLESCSETLGGIEGISPSACIDGVLLSRLAGEPASTVKDSGQRPACCCTMSRDIGSYREMPCPHGCLYCYANPRTEPAERRRAQ
jgi:DNA repair photolyase